MSKFLYIILFISLNINALSLNNIIMSLNESKSDIFIVSTDSDYIRNNKLIMSTSNMKKSGMDFNSTYLPKILNFNLISKHIKKESLNLHLDRFKKLDVNTKKNAYTIRMYDDEIIIEPFENYLKSVKKYRFKIKDNQKFLYYINKFYEEIKKEKEKNLKILKKKFKTKKEYINFLNKK
jgi:hypothetical protein